MVPFQFFLNHMNLVQPLNAAMTYFVEPGRLSAEARQIMTKASIRLGAKYILYWDDDTLPPRKGLYTLHNWMERHPEAGAITGVYTTREDPPEPLIYMEHGTGAAWDFPMGLGAEPVPIFSCGAGFLLVRTCAITETIERLQKENGGKEVAVWADGRTVPNKKDANRMRIMWGHDVRFCKILQETGWPVYVHGEVLCDHLDIATGKMYSVPPDAPGFRMRPNLNTAEYWDQIYGEEGANTWRQYPELFQKITDLFERDSAVLELGCGVGVLGSKLTAEKGADYTGYDISQVAVDISKARFLNAEVKSIQDIDYIGQANVVATELVEHLDRPVFEHLMDKINTGATTRFIFSVPDDCLSPEECPEHTVAFNRKKVREYVKPWLGEWSLKILNVNDPFHILCVMERNGNTKKVSKPRKSKKGNGRVSPGKTKKRVRSSRNQPQASCSDSS
jgi:hypothetical protein